MKTIDLEAGSGITIKPERERRMAYEDQRC
jgi:hypothetical protein